MTRPSWRSSPTLVVVATGSEPDERYPHALSAVAVLRGAEARDRVVVIDEEGHRKGSGVAETLARSGCEVTLVGDGIDPAGSLALTLADAPTLRRLAEARVRVVRDARVIFVGSGEVAVESPRGRETLTGAVVHAGRHRPVDGLVARLREHGVQATAVGDARAPGLVDGAIRSGHDVAAAL